MPNGCTALPVNSFRMADTKGMGKDDCRTAAYLLLTPLQSSMHKHHSLHTETNKLSLFLCSVPSHDYDCKPVIICLRHTILPILSDLLTSHIPVHSSVVMRYGALNSSETECENSIHIVKFVKSFSQTYISCLKPEVNELRSYYKSNTIQVHCKTYQFTLIRKTRIVYCQNHMTQINKLCGQNAEFINVKNHAVYIVTTLLYGG
jgi:hypothetical protein